MRVLNVLRNSIFALTAYFIVAVLGFVVRKLFVQYLPVELLGLEGLFGNVIAFLSLAELGIGEIISYGLYRELAADNKKEINVLMNIYRYVYFIIGIFVFVVAVGVFLCLPFIVQDKSVEWIYVQYAFALQIGAVLCSYFLAYQRTIFTADQKDYVCIKVDTIFSIVSSCIRIFALVVLQNYFIYAGTALVCNLSANIIIAFLVRNQYPFLHKVKVSLADMREKNFFKDVKNFLIHKIAYLVYGGTDAIVVSSLLGLRMTGLLANYLLIQTGVYGIIYKMFQGVRPSVGNLVYSAEKDKIYSVYAMMDMAYLIVGSYLGGMYLILLQPFVGKFFGARFLLPNEYVVALAVFTFVGMQFENAYNFRTAFGKFENDRNYMVISAISKIVVAILAVKYFGVVGIIIGAFVGVSFILYGRVQFVFRLIFEKPMTNYLLKHLFASVLIFVEWFLIWWLFADSVLLQSYLGMIVAGLSTVAILTLCHIICFYRTDEFKQIIQYLQQIIGIVRSKV